MCHYWRPVESVNAIRGRLGWWRIDLFRSCRTPSRSSIVGVGCKICTRPQMTPSDAISAYSVYTQYVEARPMLSFQSAIECWCVMWRWDGDTGCSSLGPNCGSRRRLLQGWLPLLRGIPFVRCKVVHMHVQRLQLYILIAAGGVSRPGRGGGRACGRVGGTDGNNEP